MEIALLIRPLSRTTAFLAPSKAVASSLNVSTHNLVIGVIDNFSFPTKNICLVDHFALPSKQTR